MLLSIMIPYTNRHLDDYYYISNKLQKQIERNNLTEQVEIISDGRGYEITLGQKRNDMLDRCTGEYCCGVDADDDVSDDYILKIVTALSEGDYDTVGLNILMTTDGKREQMCYHSLQHKEWYAKGNSYYRSVTQFNPTKTVLCKQARFPTDIRYGDDHEFSKRVTPLCKTEIMIDDIIYYYKVVTGFTAKERGFE